MKRWFSKDIDLGEGSVVTLVEADKLRLLYRQSYPAVFVSMIISAMLAAILWFHAQQSLALIWFCAIMATSLVRLGLFAAYWRVRPEGGRVLAWRMPYMVTLMLSSMVWGLGVPWVVPADSLVHQAIAYYFLMGMSGGALSVYSPVRSFATMTVLLLLAPMTVWMSVQAVSVSGGEISWDSVLLLMAAASVVYLISALRATQVLSSALRQSFELTHELTLAKEEAETLARIDTLTGLHNRRAFIELAEGAVGLCRRSAQPVTVIILDIDHFKRVNDSLGHAVGDLVLQRFAKVLRASLRETDICARLGGEEFAVLMPNTDYEGGVNAAEKLRQAIASNPVLILTKDGSEVIQQVTASLGVSQSMSASLEKLMSLADRAMYDAKRAGRNRVCYTETIEVMRSDA